MIALLLAPRRQKNRIGIVGASRYLASFEIINQPSINFFFVDFLDNEDLPYSNLAIFTIYRSPEKKYNSILRKLICMENSVHFPV